MWPRLVRLVPDVGKYRLSCRGLAGDNKALFELRQYDIHPSNLVAFVKLTEEMFHLRTAHSKLIGYWTSEFGGLSQVIHIWPYESLSARATVRKNLAEDQTWVNDYLSKIIPMVQRQDNSTLLPAGDLLLETAPKPGGLYELQSLQLSTPDTGDILSRFVEQTHRTEGPTTLLGAFSVVHGEANSVVLLWHHPAPDDCVSASHAIRQSTPGRDLWQQVTRGHCKLMLPHKVSPLQ